MALTKDPNAPPQPGSRAGPLIGLQLFFIIVALLVYGLRVYTRRFILNSLGSDDYIMGISVVSLSFQITSSNKNLKLTSSPALQHSALYKRMHQYHPRLGTPPLFNPRIQRPFTPPLNLPLRAPLHDFHLPCQTLNPYLLPPSRCHSNLPPYHLLQYRIYLYLGSCIFMRGDIRTLPPITNHHSYFDNKIRLWKADKE
jgi:hypothetical protein